MEKRDNQNSGIGLGLKVMIVLCMVFTVYNSYLTVQSREEVVAMKTTLEEILTKVEEPVIVTNTKTIIKEEKKAVQKTEAKQAPKAETKPAPKAESKPVQKVTEKEVQKAVQTETATNNNQAASTTTPTPKPAKKARAIPSAKVRMEDRYVEGELPLPQGKFTEEGTITIQIYIDLYGRVTKTEVLNSTIQDEDIIYACREAALKTDFSLDLHASHNSRLKGTITYTFTAQ